MTDLRYPIGKFHFDGPLTADQKHAAFDDIATAPANLRAAIKGLSEAQLDTPYRPGRMDRAAGRRITCPTAI